MRRSKVRQGGTAWQGRAVLGVEAGRRRKARRGSAARRGGAGRARGQGRWGGTAVFGGVGQGDDVTQQGDSEGRKKC